MTTLSSLYTLYKDDNEFWDGLVALTVTTDRNATEGGDKTDIVARVKPTPLEKARRVFGEINVQGSDTAFVIPDTLLVNIRAADQELRQGDKLTDTSVSPNVVYIIQNSRHMHFGTQWFVTSDRRRT